MTESIAPDRQRRVRIFSIVFPPDGVSTAQLLGEIAEDLVAAGYGVEVVTTRPHYNRDSAAELARPIRWRWHRLYGTSDAGNVRAIHVNMPSKAHTAVGRIFQWLWFHLGSLVACFRGGADVALTVSPPPTVSLVCALRRGLRGPRFGYLVWESYPDILVALGLLSDRSLRFRVLKRLEALSYGGADRVAFLHEDMKEAAAQSVPATASKMQVIPTFADVEFLQPGTRRTPLREECGVGDRFVVGYGGNLGVAQDLSSLVEAARRLGPDQLELMVCGDGNDRDRLERIAADLPNVHFTGQLAYQRVPEMYASFDVSVVALSGSVAAEALPSKLYRSMACGRPILAVAPRDSTLGRFVERHQVGWVVPPSSPDELAATLREIIAQPAALAAQGERARAVAVAEYSRAVVMRRYRELVESLFT